MAFQSKKGQGVIRGRVKRIKRVHCKTIFLTTFRRALEHAAASAAECFLKRSAAGWTRHHLLRGGLHLFGLSGELSYARPGQRLPDLPLNLFLSLGGHVAPNIGNNPRRAGFQPSLALVSAHSPKRVSLRLAERRK